MGIVRTIMVACVAFLIAGCSGTTLTLDEGIAYRMTRTQAMHVAENVIAIYNPNDYVLPTKGLTASGYKRLLARHSQLLRIGDTDGIERATLAIKCSLTHGEKVEGCQATHSDHSA